MNPNNVTTRDQADRPVPGKHARAVLGTSNDAEGPEWRLSRHARLRAAERSMTAAEVLAVICEPEVSYCQPDRGPAVHVCQRGALAVVVDQEARVVITVLLRSTHLWSNDDARARRVS